MTESTAPDQVVQSPTYMADIRFFFRPDDVAHMGAMGIDLGTYDGVKNNALAILAHTAPPDADMPPDQAGKWSDARSQTFRNWIRNGYPQGSATSNGQGTSPGQGTSTGQGTSAGPDRVRKNVANLSAPEIETLKTAFTGIMARSPDDPASYFALAGEHGLPHAWCMHHENRFEPWHRVYLRQFEDALRSVPGCANVTLPYWDVTTPLPDLLRQPPFASYTLPQDPGVNADPPQPGHYFPYRTIRSSPADITQNMQDLGVFDDIDTARSQTRFGTFNTSGYQDFSIQAHDGGHLSVGRTMGDQNVSAYDPAFWFYHCNLDRIWLDWQVKLHADTVAGFTSVVDGDASWLSQSPDDLLTGFDGQGGLPATTAGETIAFGISYDAEEPEAALENKVGSLAAARTFSISRSDPVSVRVKDIERLSIPGSFVIKLLADGQPIAKRAFFQPDTPRNCANCRKQALVNIDFRIDQDKLLDRKLSVQIEVPGLAGIGTSFPLSQAGNPTINARLLLQDE